MELAKNPKMTNQEILRCPQCGGELEVQFVGDMRDKRAFCRHCGTEIDIPDTYQRVNKKRSSEWKISGMQSVEDTLIESRSDRSENSNESKPLPPEIQKIMKQIKKRGVEAINAQSLRTLKFHGVRLSFDSDALTPEVLEALKGKNFDLSYGQDSQSEKTLFIRTIKQTPGFFEILFNGKHELRDQNPLLDTEKTVKIFGIAPAPGDTIKCPNPKCDAKIPKTAMKCSWCGWEI
jgi:hypothetical protein